MPARTLPEQRRETVRLVVEHEEARDLAAGSTVALNVAV
jgi:hypothetical protein